MFLFLSYNPSPFSSGGSTASPSSENLLVILVLSSSSSSLPSSFIHDQQVITKCSKWERSSFTISQLETEVWLVWSLLLSVFLYQNENLHFSQDVWGNGGCQSLSVSFFKHSILRNQGNIREVVAALKLSQRIFKKKSLLFLLPLFATNLPLLLWMLMLVSSSLLSLSSTSTKIQTWAQWSSPSLSVYSYNPSPFSSGGSTASHLLWKPHGDLRAGLLLLIHALVFCSFSSTISSLSLKCSKWARSSSTSSQWETEVYLLWSLLENENLHFSWDFWGVCSYQNLYVSFFRFSIFRYQGYMREVVAALEPSQRIFKKKSLLFHPPLFAIHLQDRNSASLTSVYSSNNLLWLLLRKYLFRDVGAALLAHFLVQVIQLQQEVMCWLCVVLDRSSLGCNH